MATRDEMARSFGAQAGAYERGRPEYPAEAVEWMLEPTGFASGGASPRVADIGAGTGKLTRVVRAVLDAHGGGDVIAIEPDVEMLAALREAVPGVETLVGTAESTVLPSASLDAVVLGQARHWVDPVVASRELGRVLKPAGVVGLVWNVRDESVGWVSRLTEIMHASAGERYVGERFPDEAFVRGRWDEVSRSVLRAPFDEVQARSWRWTRAITRAGLLDMVRSRSYVITADAAERERIESQLGELFDEIGAVGEASIELPYITAAFRAVLPASGPGATA